MSLLLHSDTCNACGGTLCVEEEDLVCKRCAIVYDQKIANFGYDPDVDEDGMGGRTGPAHNPKYSLPGTELATSTSKSNPLSSIQKFNAKKLQKLDKQLKTDRIKISAFMDINKVQDELAINQNTVELAQDIFNQCRKKKLLKGRNRRVFAAGCIYTACKINNIPRSLFDFCKSLSVKNNQIIKIHHLIHRNIEFQQSIQEPEQFLPKIKNSIPISLKTENLAKSFLKRYHNREGKSPKILMGAAIYLASRETIHISQREIAMALDCSEMSIRNRAKELSAFLSIEILKNSTKI